MPTGVPVGICRFRLTSAERESYGCNMAPSDSPGQYRTAPAVDPAQLSLTMPIFTAISTACVRSRAWSFS